MLLKYRTKCDLSRKWKRKSEARKKCSGNKQQSMKMTWKIHYTFHFVRGGAAHKKTRLNDRIKKKTTKKFLWIEAQDQDANENYSFLIFVFIWNSWKMDKLCKPPRLSIFLLKFRCRFFSMVSNTLFLNSRYSKNITSYFIIKFVM